MSGAGGSNSSCATQQRLAPELSPAISAVMFSAGLLGNLAALALLGRRRRLGRRGRPLSLFHGLVTALVLTDLLGTCLVSPVVLAAYGRHRALVALAAERRLCRYFGFAMSFFGLATPLALFAMALERALALGRPYLYERFVRRRAAPLLALPAAYALAAAFCALPLLGVGRYVQYCPGTWCFIRMAGGERDAAYSLLYATLLLLLILAVLLCNLSVSRDLLAMHRRGQTSRRLAALDPAGRRRLSVAEEVDHLVLLVIMTITFFVCSLPFTIRAYMNKFNEYEDHEKDLLALRFLAINPIIDPWVFVILRPSVLRVIRSVLCCQMSLKTQDNRQTTPAADSKSNKQHDLCGQ